MEQKEKQTIKNLYKDLIEVVKINHPDYYIMPLIFYKRIMETISQLDADLKRVKKSRDRLKLELKELKACYAKKENTQHNAEVVQ